MVKDFDYVLDLAKLTEEVGDLETMVEKCTARRAVPLTPADFREALAAKSFTSKKADEAMVGRLYEATFGEKMGGATKLDYRNLQWGDAEAVMLSRVIASGAMPKLEGLRLEDNQIGDAGCTALAEACGSGALSQLKSLYLDLNQIGDEGMKALAAAIARGALPQLKVSWRPTALFPCLGMCIRLTPKVLVWCAIHRFLPLMATRPAKRPNRQ